MKAVFVDTSFFLASLNPNDELHKKAIATSREISALRLTTAFVLLEVANSMSGSGQWANFVNFYEQIRVHRHARIIPVSEDVFQRRYVLNADRKDKDWSLTDCISFVVMSDESLTEALTYDHHFEQAGFAALLR
jgi:predicted nucleic acid-binding protein